MTADCARGENERRLQTAATAGKSCAHAPNTYRYRGMQLKLKEKPSEWVKFTAVMAVFPAVMAFLLYRRGHVQQVGLLTSWGVLLLVLAACALRPRACRWFYRLGMTVTFHVGQVVGCVLLALLFLLVVTPLGLVMRLLGKDLLGLKRREASSHWHVSRGWGPLDRMF